MYLGLVLLYNLILSYLLNMLLSSLVQYSQHLRRLLIPLYVLQGHRLLLLLQLELLDLPPHFFIFLFDLVDFCLVLFYLFLYLHFALDEISVLILLHQSFKLHLFDVQRSELLVFGLLESGILFGGLLYLEYLVLIIFHNKRCHCLFNFFLHLLIPVIVEIQFISQLGQFGFLEDGALLYLCLDLVDVHAFEMAQRLTSAAGRHLVWVDRFNCWVTIALDDTPGSMYLIFNWLQRVLPRFGAWFRLRADSVALRAGGLARQVAAGGRIAMAWCRTLLYRLQELLFLNALRYCAWHAELVLGVHIVWRWGLDVLDVVVLVQERAGSAYWLVITRLCILDSRAASTPSAAYSPLVHLAAARKVVNVAVWIVVEGAKWTEIRV